MVAITKPVQRPNHRLFDYGLAILQAAVAFSLGRLSGWWVFAAAVIVLIELRSYQTALAGARSEWWWRRMPGLLMGLGSILIITQSPRIATQAAVAVAYGLWLVWWNRRQEELSRSWAQLLLVQAVAMEAIFLSSALWRVPVWLTLIFVWVVAYVSVYATLTLRQDRSAGVIAATWGVIATEVAWILSQWLITYTMSGGYVLVPQPALILTALAYVFGNILSSSRRGNLSRARLSEYLVIGFVLVLIVALGTTWRGSV